MCQRGGNRPAAADVRVREYAQYALHTASTRNRLRALTLDACLDTLMHYYSSFILSSWAAAALADEHRSVMGRPLENDTTYGIQAHIAWRGVLSWEGKTIRERRVLRCAGPSATGHVKRRQLHHLHFRGAEACKGVKTGQVFSRDICSLQFNYFIVRQTHVQVFLTCATSRSKQYDQSGYTLSNQISPTAATVWPISAFHQHLNTSPSYHLLPDHDGAGQQLPSSTPTRMGTSLAEKCRHTLLLSA